MLMRSLSPQYWGPIKLNIAAQVIAVFFASLILDGGFIARLVVFAMFGYWVGVFIIALRRPQAPSRLDKFFLGGGFILLFFTVVLPLTWLVTRLGLLR